MDTILQTGKCRICGCTAETPCLDEEENPCAWMDAAHTLCDNIDCIAQVTLAELEKMVAP
jgi:hypothetical protein